MSDINNGGATARRRATDRTLIAFSLAIFFPIVADGEHVLKSVLRQDGTHVNLSICLPSSSNDNMDTFAFEIIEAALDQ